MINLLNSGVQSRGYSVTHHFSCLDMAIFWRGISPQVGAWRNPSGDYQDVGRRGCQVGGFAVPARRRWPLGVQGTNRMRGWWRRDATQLNGILIFL